MKPKPLALSFWPCYRGLGRACHAYHRLVGSLLVCYAQLSFSRFYDETFDYRCDSLRFVRGVRLHEVVFSRGKTPLGEALGNDGRDD